MLTTLNDATAPSKQIDTYVCIYIYVCLNYTYLTFSDNPNRDSRRGSSHTHSLEATEATGTLTFVLLHQQLIIGTNTVKHQL